MTSIAVSQGISITAAGRSMEMPRSPAPLPQVSSAPVVNGVSNRDETRVGIDSAANQDKVRKKEAAEAVEAVGSSRKSEFRTMKNILFAYNQKGDLRIRFMDSENRLVYQTPPELFSKMSDIMTTPRTSVNMRI